MRGRGVTAGLRQLPSSKPASQARVGKCHRKVLISQAQGLMTVTLGRAKEGGSSLGLGGSWLKGDMPSRSVTLTGTTTPKDVSPGELTSSFSDSPHLTPPSHC